MMKNLFFFLYLNKRTIFEHLVQEETNTDSSGFTFQNPFTIYKWFWKVKSKISVYPYQFS